MIRAQSKIGIPAPPSAVMKTYLDYERWPEIFPRTISAVTLVSQRNGELVVDVHHVEGVVRNILRALSPREIELQEWKKHFYGRFINRFDDADEGTLYTITAEISVKWPFKPFEAFLHGYVERSLRTYAAEPLREAVISQRP